MFEGSRWKITSITEILSLAKFSKVSKNNFLKIDLEVVTLKAWREKVSKGPLKFLVCGHCHSIQQRIWFCSRGYTYREVKKKYISVLCDLWFHILKYSMKSETRFWSCKTLQIIEEKILDTSIYVKCNSKNLLFFTFVPCVVILSKIYLFTNWCTSELS